MLQAIGQLVQHKRLQVSEFQSTPDLVVGIFAKRIEVEAQSSRKQHRFLPQAGLFNYRQTICSVYLLVQQQHHQQQVYSHYTMWTLILLILLLLLLLLLLLQLLYSHCPSQPVLASTLAKNENGRISLEQSFTACMPLLKATAHSDYGEMLAFASEPQRCYLHRLQTTTPSLYCYLLTYMVDGGGGHWLVRME